MSEGWPETDWSHLPSSTTIPRAMLDARIVTTVAAHGEHEAGAGVAVNELNVQDFALSTFHGRQARRWWSDQDSHFFGLLENSSHSQSDPEESSRRLQQPAEKYGIVVATAQFVISRGGFSQPLTALQHLRTQDATRVLPATLVKQILTAPLLYRHHGEVIDVVAVRHK
ncbi:hypothetical protein E4U19_005786 [Claviceps sp. Clav32 group G5]|nr:hypothetical protein E4U19_005786 [Claviceps sp. Clav32 group G5]